MYTAMHHMPFILAFARSELTTRIHQMSLQQGQALSHISIAQATLPHTKDEPLLP